jgi:nucleoside-diphosphate-sugar epimerase
MAHGKVTILGINGHIGNATAAAFAAAGWEVVGFGRSNKRPIPGVRFVKGDARNVEDMRAAIGDSDVVVQALHLPYNEWTNGRAEAQLAAVIEAVGGGRTLLFPGTIYNYSATDRFVTPDLEQVPETPRGEIRVRLEQMLKAAAESAGGPQVVILRAGDFYGPQTTGDWFDQGILREAHKGKAAVLGQRGIGHSWAYLPDLARAFEVLARRRAEFAGFENFHFAGHFVTPEQMMAALKAGSPVPLKVSNFPWFILSLVGIADPIMRDISRMGYLWRNAMEIRDSRLDAILGAGFGTPFDEAVATVMAPFFTAQRVAA